MSVELGHYLTSHEAITRSQLRNALADVLVHRISLIRALVDQEAITEDALDQVLQHTEIPLVRSVFPLANIMDVLPPDLCSTLLAVPIRSDSQTSTVLIAAADPFDPHVEKEFSYHLGTAVRVLRAPLTAIENAVFGRRSSIPSVPPDPDVEDRTTFPAGSLVSVRTPPSDHPVPTTPVFSGEHERSERNSQIPIPLVKRSDPPNMCKSATDESDLSRPATGFRAESFAPEAHPTSTTKSTWIAGSSSDFTPWVHESPTTVKWPPQNKHAAIPSQPRAAPATAPISPSSKPTASSPDDILTSIRHATRREDVLQHALVGMQNIAARTGIFTVRENMFVGCACSAPLCDGAAFRSLQIPIDAPTVLAVAASHGHYWGRLAPTPAQQPLLEVLRIADQEVSITAARADDHTTLLAIAIDLYDAVTGTQFAKTLVSEASQALARIHAIEEQTT